MDDRTMLAAMALQGLTAKYGRDPFFYLHAVECADALLARLAETAPAEALADPAPEPDGEHGWSEAMERAIADAIEIAAVRGTGDEDMAYRIARAVIAVERAERPVVLPPGWVAVPGEPTDEMLDAGLPRGMTGCHPAGEAYRAMLAAAPPCPGLKESEQ